MDTSPAGQLREQWRNPSDIFSLLLLLGGDIVQVSLAQLAGHATVWPAPVPFSMGWVAYSFQALSAAARATSLMPSQSEVPSVLINARSGSARPNNSWLLGRLLRDFEEHWIHADARAAVERVQGTAPKRGLCICVYTALPPTSAPYTDLVWYSGWLTIAAQLVIAAIPWMLWSGESEIFLITLAGTALALVMGSLPQWARERSMGRHESNKTFVLTRGNGAQFALVIRADGVGRDLEDLAAAVETPRLSTWERALVVGLTVCWVALLLTATGLKTHTWFLVAVAGLGMAHNLCVAALPRSPSGLGIPLQYSHHVVHEKVFAAIQDVEQGSTTSTPPIPPLPFVGLSMLDIFFPNSLSSSESQWRQQIEQRLRHPASAPQPPPTMAGSADLAAPSTGPAASINGPTGPITRPPASTTGQEARAIGSAMPTVNTTTARPL